MIELIEKYNARYREFTSINDLNLLDRLKQVPAEKHFWAARLLEARIEGDKLDRKRKSMIKQAQNSLIDSSPVAIITKDTLKKVETSEIIENIDKEILLNKRLIQHLENIYSSISFIANDMKNIIDMIKMQSE